MRRHRMSLAWTGLGLALLSVFALLSASGWADATSVLSGTPAPGSDPVRGLAFVAARLAAGIVAPILLLAAALRVPLLRLLEPNPR
jgi:hypothetical protein